MWDSLEEGVDDEVERNEVDDTTEELNKHSSELSSCEAAPFFPSSQLPMLENSAAIPATFWRPWEDPLKNTAADEDVAARGSSWLQEVGPE